MIRETGEWIAEGAVAFYSELMKAYLWLALFFLMVNGAFGGEVLLGNEVLAQGGFKVLKGKRVGLISNPSGANRQLDSTVEVLARAPGVKLEALFGPEHGIYGDVPAGEKVESRVAPTQSKA